MQWDDLKFVLAAARSKSFTKAAAMLKVSHTTIGRRIKALETSIGTQLFDREREGCLPTEACLELLPIAERMEAEARQVFRVGAHTPEKPKGLVQLHTASWIINRILIPAFPDLQERAPELRVFFVGDVVEDKTNLPEFSLSLRFDVMPHRSEVEVALRRIPYAVYKHRDDRRAQAQWVANFGGSVTLRTFGWLEEQGISEENVPMLADDAELVMSGVEAGVGRGLIPITLAEQSPHLKRITKGPPDLFRTLRAIVPRHTSNAPQIKTTLQWVQETLDRIPATEPAD